MAERVIDGTGLGPEAVGRAVTDLCDAAAAIDAAGDYPAIDVRRPWSMHNPMITGEFARPNAIRSYLERELRALLTMGATVTVRPSRPAVAIDDPARLRAPDETAWAMPSKKTFSFAPARTAFSMRRPAHACGTPA